MQLMLISECLASTSVAVIGFFYNRRKRYESNQLAEIRKLELTPPCRHKWKTIKSDTYDNGYGSGRKIINIFVQECEKCGVRNVETFKTNL